MSAEYSDTDPELLHEQLSELLLEEGWFTGDAMRIDLRMSGAYPVTVSDFSMVMHADHDFRLRVETRRRQALELGAAIIDVDIPPSARELVIQTDSRPINDIHICNPLDVSPDSILGNRMNSTGIPVGPDGSEEIVIFSEAEGLVGDGNIVLRALIAQLHLRNQDI